MMSSINDLRYWILSKRDTIILTIFGYKVRNRLKKNTAPRRRNISKSVPILINQKQSTQ